MRVYVAAKLGDEVTLPERIEMKVETSTLVGPPLHWAVALSQGLSVRYIRGIGCVMVDLSLVKPAGIRTYGDDSQWEVYGPSIDWAVGGPIIERERITWTGQSARLVRFEHGEYRNFEEFGPTPLIAAMRVYVAAKLGPEVEIPEELK